jgi:NTE family protein
MYSSARPFPPADIAVKPVSLALQGGGAHGAFTWGVLDRLLEDARIGFEGLSATSAGATNAVVLAHGLATGGREGARAALRDFWAGSRAPLASARSSPRRSIGSSGTSAPRARPRT